MGGIRIATTLLPRVRRRPPGPLPPMNESLLFYQRNLALPGGCLPMPAYAEVSVVVTLGRSSAG